MLGWAREHVAACIAIAIVVVLLIACACFALALKGSIDGAVGCSEKLVAEYDALKDSISATDAAGIREHASAAMQAADELDAQTDTPLWGAAQALPYYGEDARIARTLARVNARIAHEGIEPVASAYAGLLESAAADTGGSISPLLLALHADEAAQLVSALADAKPAVAEGAAEIDALDHAHFGELDAAITAARDVLDPLAKAYDALDALLAQTDGPDADAITEMLAP